MESLPFDLEPYGIHTMAVEPGFFRTELLVEGFSTIWPELDIDDYAARTDHTIEAWKPGGGWTAVSSTGPLGSIGPQHRTLPRFGVWLGGVHACVGRRRHSGRGGSSRPASV